MRQIEHEKQLLLERIEANRQLLSRDVQAVTGMLRPWRTMIELGRDAAPHLRTLGTAVGGLVASRTSGVWRKLGWLLPAAIPAGLWFLARPRR